MALIDILACPDCRARLVVHREALSCSECARSFGVRHGVPLLVPRGHHGEVAHERELKHWDDYVLAVEQIIESLPPDRIVLDMGSGNRRVDDDRIVRMDVVQTPHVDVVGDAHSLPFRDGVFDLVYASAVFEHLRQPFDAGREIHRVLRPGGFAVVDCNFVYPFHGYPAVYFNASAEGLRQVFHAFEEVAVVVAPWHMPSYALEAVIGEFLHLFQPQSPEEEAFAAALRALDKFPLHTFNRCFTQASAQRLAAGTTFLGSKPDQEDWGGVPGAIMSVYEKDAELQRRYPRPSLIVSHIANERVDSLWRWAVTEGRSRHAEIASVYDRANGYRKRPLAPEPTGHRA